MNPNLNPILSQPDLIGPVIDPAGQLDPTHGLPNSTQPEIWVQKPKKLVGFGHTSTKPKTVPLPKVLAKIVVYFNYSILTNNVGHILFFIHKIILGKNYK